MNIQCQICKSTFLQTTKLPQYAHTPQLTIFHKSFVNWPTDLVVVQAQGACRE
jgi:hypothetical protein